MNPIEETAAHLRDHANEVAGGGPGEASYDPATLVICHDVASLLDRLSMWKCMPAEELRLRCGEMTAQEIRSVRSVLKAVVGEFGT